MAYFHGHWPLAIGHRRMLMLILPLPTEVKVKIKIKQQTSATDTHQLRSSLVQYGRCWYCTGSCSCNAATSHGGCICIAPKPKLQTECTAKHETRNTRTLRVTTTATTHCMHQWPMFHGPLSFPVYWEVHGCRSSSLVDRPLYAESKHHQNFGQVKLVAAIKI